MRYQPIEYSQLVKLAKAVRELLPLLKSEDTVGYKVDITNILMDMGLWYCG